MFASALVHVWQCLAMLFLTYLSLTSYHLTFKPYMTQAVDVCRRKSYRPDLIKWADVEPEAVTGKQFRLHVKDKQGRAVLVMRPRSGFHARGL